MIPSAILGYPRIGLQRELKRALENYWKGQSSEAELLSAAGDVRSYNWALMKQAGIDFIPSNDFSFYDQVLDTTAMVGAVPSRYGWKGATVDLETYFAMARGAQRDGLDVPAMEMTKWFDTNYHYIVPEFEAGQTFRWASTKVIDEYLEAKALGIETRPVLLGPVSYLMLGKAINSEIEALSLLSNLLPVYVSVLERLAAVGASWVQIDEPCLILDLDDAGAAAYQYAYQVLSRSASINIMLTTYFGGLRDNLPLMLNLPVEGFHIDLVRAPDQLGAALSAIPANKVLSLGVIDGRNIWRTDLDDALKTLQSAIRVLGANRIIAATSCSLQFCPYDLDLETELDTDLRSWLAFARQKVAELSLLCQAANGGEGSGQLEASRQAIASRRTSARVQNPDVRQRLSQITPQMLQRTSPHAARKAAQAESLKLPDLPTTTIGSFPQTQEVRAQRAAYNQGKITREDYEKFLRSEIEHAIRFQEAIGLDVLVHGEFERTDMVEYFGEQLTGIAFTRHGWVQSYGSRAVRPPIIYGDVTRPSPMTVAWSSFAQTLTQRPMKGMLTGPVTILQWSFVRDDQPRSETCRQIALAMRDEVIDLEASGIRIIQIDEPAFREGLPLRRADWPAYLDWAAECFRLAASGVRDETQIHTHMCYAEFNDIIEAIARMDADVISIETSRSQMELLGAFAEYAYPNDIGPGVYDIHSPRVPDQAEMEYLLHRALDVLKPRQLWINPDCGLKTRSWQEVEPALRNMVEAARTLRSQVKQAAR